MKYGPWYGGLMNYELWNEYSLMNCENVMYQHMYYMKYGAWYGGLSNRNGCLHSPHKSNGQLKFWVLKFPFKNILMIFLSEELFHMVAKVRHPAIL